MKRSVISLGLALSVGACSQAPGPTPSPVATPDYFDNSGRDDVVSGGVKMIPIKTARGTFRVWTKRTGNNPRIKLLLLHGGPGATHEYLEAFDSYMPAAGVEYYYYDQLGSAYSDQPDKPELWEIPRFVEEVEQVREALKLDRDNFYLLGHSWGGILAIEYALAHQDHLRGLVISNMMASVPAYNEYAHRVLMPAMDQKALREILSLEAAKRYDDSRYEELLMGAFYSEHIVHMPPESWPEPVLRSFGRLNRKIYVPMQGPSEMGASGRLEKWDRFADLKSIRVPTLVIGAQHDTMDPAYMEKMAHEFPKGHYLFCPNGSHMAFYDDPQTYFPGLVKFLKEGNSGT
jgi:proline iminopeptidase